MSVLRFPDEPIRYPTLPDQTAAERAEEAFDDYEPEEECMSCEDGVVVCDGSVGCPEADDAGCPFTDFHTYCCGNCGGSGLAKDQRFS